MPNPDPCTRTMRASRAPVLVASPTSGSVIVDCSCSLMVRPRDLAAVQVPHLHRNGHTARGLGLLFGFLLPHGHDRSAVCGAFRGKSGRRLDERLGSDRLRNMYEYYGGCVVGSTTVFSRRLDASNKHWPPGGFRNKLARIVNHVASSRSRLIPTLRIRSC